MSCNKGGFLGRYLSGGYTGKRLAGKGEVAEITGGPDSWTFAEAVSDPLQEAITSTEIACRTAEGMTLLVLQDHLSRLCKMQRKQFKDAD